MILSPAFWVMTDPAFAIFHIHPKSTLGTPQRTVCGFMSTLSIYSQKLLAWTRRAKCHQVCVKESISMLWIPHRLSPIKGETPQPMWPKADHTVFTSTSRVFSHTEMGKDAACDSYSLTSWYIENWNLASIVITMITGPCGTRRVSSKHNSSSLSNHCVDLLMKGSSNQKE